MTELCRKIRDAVALDGAAPTEPEAREHLAGCAECRAFVDSVLAVEGEIDALVDEDVSDEVVAKLLARPELTKPAPTAVRMRFVAGLAAAVVLGAVAMSVTFRGQEQVTAPLRSRVLEGVMSGGSGVANAEIPLDEKTLDELRALGYVDGNELAEPTAQLRREMPEPPGRAGAFDQDARLEESQSLQDRKDDLAKTETDFAARIDVPVAASPKPSGAASSADPEPVAPAEVPLARFMLEVEDPVPGKRVHVDPSFERDRRRSQQSGTVVVQLTVDREGNVIDARIVESVPAFDEAVLEAVLQWKYEPADVDRPPFRVEVEVEGESPRPEDPSDAHAFLMERSRIEGLTFREPRGYWANTYLPGDPVVRRLEAKLRAAALTNLPHAAARPVAAELDAPARGALSVSMTADRRGLDGPARLLVQVGLKAALQHGRRRPPMNVALVVDGASASREMRALASELVAARELGDRFRLYASGHGELVGPDDFRHGPVRVALEGLTTNGDLTHAVELAIRAVHAGDDPNAPLGTSLVLIATSRPLGDVLDPLRRLAHQSAVGGVPVSVIGVGGDASPFELDPVALDGQGRRYQLTEPSGARTIVERELLASSRAVARALRLRIKLADGVRLVDVVDSYPLSERQASRVREAEKSIDLRLSRNLGIEADRGDDEDGIQIVIPSFYAGDEHAVLLDVVAPGPGAVADVTVRYKDLTELRNTVARAGLTLTRHQATEAAGPRETQVRKSFLAHRLAAALAASGDALARGDHHGAMSSLRRMETLLAGLDLRSHEEVARDVRMLQVYQALVDRATPRSLAYLVDSLHVASAYKKYLSLTDT